MGDLESIRSVSFLTVSFTLRDCVVTGSDNCPMGGFKNLQPGFTVYLYANSANANGENPAAERNKLPNSHTCSNQIDIPLYESEKLFIEKIYAAINADLAMGSP
jgi:hypothetical protein